MGWWLPAAGVVVGFAVTYLVSPGVPGPWAPYLSLATLAGLDSVLGGIRAGIEGKFHQDIFLSGFIVNALLAIGLQYLGEQIGVELYLAAVVLLGGRIFLNLSLIRRYALTQAAASRKRE